MKAKTAVRKDKSAPAKGKKGLVLKGPRKLSANEALKELVTKRRVLPACESSSACARKTD